MVELKALREALAARLETIPAHGGFRRPQVFPRMKSMITPPTIVVAYPEEVEYHHASQTESRWMMVVFGVAPGDLYDETAQNMLDAWLADSGAHSVSAALEAVPQLGGLVEDVTVHRSEGYQVFVVGGQQYLGTEWKVEVLG